MAAKIRKSRFSKKDKGGDTLYIEENKTIHIPDEIIEQLLDLFYEETETNIEPPTRPFFGNLTVSADTRTGGVGLTLRAHTARQPTELNPNDTSLECRSPQIGNPCNKE
jgi:hypothetical protein